MQRMCTYTLSDQPAPRSPVIYLGELAAAAGVGPAGRRHQRTPLWRTSAPGLHALTPPTSAPGLIGPTPPTSALGLDSTRPHLHRDCMGLTPPISAPGQGLRPIQLRKLNQTNKQINKQPRIRRNGQDGRRRPVAVASAFHSLPRAMRRLRRRMRCRRRMCSRARRSRT